MLIEFEVGVSGGKYKEREIMEEIMKEIKKEIKKTKKT